MRPIRTRIAPYAAAAFALALVCAAAALPARADFSSGQLKATVGVTSDRNTTSPICVVGEQVEVLLEMTITEGTLAPFADVVVAVPAGLDLVSAGVVSRGNVTFDTIATIGGVGNGGDAVIRLTLVSNTDNDSSTDDFITVGAIFVVRDGAVGSLPLQFSFSLGGTTRGTAEVVLIADEAEFTITHAVSPTSGIDVGDPVTVKITVEYPGSGPSVYNLEVRTELSGTVQGLSTIATTKVPPGYSLAVEKTGKQSSNIVFRPPSGTEFRPLDKLELEFSFAISSTQPILPSMTVTSVASGDTVNAAPPQGEIGRVEEATNATTITTLDSDRDGLTNAQERAAGTGVTSTDTDRDGVPDGDEPGALEDLDGDGRIGALDPDSDGDRLPDGVELGIAGKDQDTSTTTDAALVDTDGDGVADGTEDKNRNGRKDKGELDPNDPTDAAAKLTAMADEDADGLPDFLDPEPEDPPATPFVDSDGDGVLDAIEAQVGTDPGVADEDSDDDGIPDLDEEGGYVDADGDGLAGVMDPDADDDGVLDGVEAGVAAADVDPAHTDLAFFVPDADPATTTAVLDDDTDGDGIPDGYEDLDRDGQVDVGETDPSDGTDAAQFDATDGDGDGVPDIVEAANGLDPADADGDDDGVTDAFEAGPLVDVDRDGRIGALDPDADGDGILDGVESGVTARDDDTDRFSTTFRADADPGTTTSASNPDSDFDGVPDGFEDFDHDGKVDAGESDPNDGGDVPADLADSDGDGIPDVVARAAGIDPADDDADDDGVPNPDEAAPFIDTDQDGTIGALDPDSDNDAIADGVEAAAGTDPLEEDTDGDGLPDAWEDLDRDGVVAATETDPTDPADAGQFDATDTDGDGIPDVVESAFGIPAAGGADADGDGIEDGDEPAGLADVDGDGRIGILDADADGDGLPDGLEMGVKGDLDPSTTTNPRNRDSDGDGKPDGEEDLNRNGRVDFGETDPAVAESGRPRRPQAQSGSGCAAAGGLANPAALLPFAGLAGALAAARGARRRRGLGGGGGGAATGILVAIAAMVVTSGATAPAADEGFQTHHYRPVNDGLGVIVVPSPDVLPPLTFFGGVYYDHTADPAEIGDAGTGDRISGLVRKQDAFTFVAAIGLPANLEAGVSVPVFFYTSAQKFDDPDRDVHGGGFGDVRFDAKWRALVAADEQFALGADLFIVARTGDEEEYASDGAASAGLLVLAEGRVFERLRLLGEVGYEWLDGAVEFAGVEIDDRLRLGGAGGVMVWRDPPLRKKAAGGPAKSGWRLDIEAAVEAFFRADDLGDDLSAPVELYLGARLDTPAHVTIALGPSFGISDGIGATEWRFFLGVGYTFGAPPRNAWRFAKG